MKKLLLSGMALMLAVGFSYGQATMTSTQYHDNFDDNTIASDAEQGWYNSANYSSITETGGKLVVTANNADQYFNGFGLYLKPTTKINISSDKTVKLDVTNPSSTVAISLRLDLRLRDAAFTGPNCPTASGDTVNINKGVTGSATNGATVANNVVTIPANTTTTVTFNVGGASAGYEYNTTCGGAWTPTTYTIPSTAYQDVVGLYLVVNGGAGESWCTTPDVCTAYSGTVSIDNLMIGNTTTGTQKASANIASSKLFPNPVSGLANVELNLKSNSDVKVTLSDMMGKEVMIIANETTASLNKSFNTSGLNQGIYTVNYYINGQPAKAELLMVK